MPTDVRVSTFGRREAERKAAADLRACVLLFPVIASLASILLCAESNAFEFSVPLLGAN
jgi:hypothetical protein